MSGDFIRRVYPVSAHFARKVLVGFEFFARMRFCPFPRGPFNARAPGISAGNPGRPEQGRKFPPIPFRELRIVLPSFHASPQSLQPDCLERVMTLADPFEI